MIPTPEFSHSVSPETYITFYSSLLVAVIILTRHAHDGAKFS